MDAASNGSLQLKWYRSCIAPLDVLKIRLQLQVHSLSDPLSSRDAARAARYGIGNTFKAIVCDEGITVGPHQGMENTADYWMLLCGRLYGKATSQPHSSTSIMVPYNSQSTVPLRT